MKKKKWPKKKYEKEQKTKKKLKEWTFDRDTQATLRRLSFLRIGTPTLTRRHSLSSSVLCVCAR